MRSSVHGAVIGQPEQDNLIDVAKREWYTHGQYTDELERRLADYIGVREAAFCNSGSSANLLALSALTDHTLPETRRILPGDEDGDNYAGLLEAGRIARHNQIPLVLSGWYQSTWGSWVAQYYLDHDFHMSPPATGDFIEVSDQPKQAHGNGLLLSRQGRTWIYLNSATRMTETD